MPISLPSFTPQVRSGAVSQLPKADDFSSSVAKGYEAGKILSGEMRKIENLKIASELQKMQLQAEKHPLELAKLRAETAYAPFKMRGEVLDQAKDYSDILGSPGVYTEPKEGPSLLTQSFAAPEGSGPPKDLVKIPGMDDVYKSPSAASEFELKKKSAFSDTEAALAGLTPEEQILAFEMSNEYKSRLGPKALPSAAAVIREEKSKGVPTSEIRDNIQDRMSEFSNPHLWGEPQIKAALDQAMKNISKNRRPIHSNIIDNYLDPSKDQFDPNQGFHYILDLAKSGVKNETDRKVISANEALIGQMNLIKNVMDKLPEDVRTNLLQGGIQKMAAYGKVNAIPELQQLDVITRKGLATYLLQISGVAVHREEYTRTMRDFPNILNSGSLNMSKIEGLQRSAANEVHSRYGSVFGPDRYRDLREHFQSRYGYRDVLSQFPYVTGTEGDREPPGRPTISTEKNVNPVTGFDDDEKSYLKKWGAKVD